MTYLTMRKAFHMPDVDHERLYQQRFSSEHTFSVGIEIAGMPAFLHMAPELYEQLLSIANLDKRIHNLRLALPAEAVEDYLDSLLVDEIVITNNIEGVGSTRREVGDTLELLACKDKRGRFTGIVRAYRTLSSGANTPLSTCADIRAAYDAIVLDEVLHGNPHNTPDGELFRKGPVQVIDGSGRTIHCGLAPESAIIAALEAGLAFLHDEAIPLLARIAVFHFLFGYAHPFYDGNGRISRFISSSYLAREYEPMAALTLSWAVERNIDSYYGAFRQCEHELNRGDLTPFALSFCSIVKQGMEEQVEQLSERKHLYERCLQQLELRIDGKAAEVARQVLIDTLFSFNGSDALALAQKLGLSRQTVYKRLDSLKKADLLTTERVGHKTCHKLKTDLLLG